MVGLANQSGFRVPENAVRQNSSKVGAIASLAGEQFD